MKRIILLLILLLADPAASADQVVHRVGPWHVTQLYSNCLINYGPPSESTEELRISLHASLQSTGLGAATGIWFGNDFIRMRGEPRYLVDGKVFAGDPRDREASGAFDQIGLEGDRLLNGDVLTIWYPLDGLARPLRATFSLSGLEQTVAWVEASPVCSAR